MNWLIWESTSCGMDDTALNAREISGWELKEGYLFLVIAFLFSFMPCSMFMLRLHLPIRLAEVHLYLSTPLPRAGCG